MQFIWLGNTIYCLKITFLSSTTFLALNGGLNNKNGTFQRASSNNRLPRNKYQPCYCTLDFEALMVPYLKESQA